MGELNDVVRKKITIHHKIVVNSNHFIVNYYLHLQLLLLFTIIFLLQLLIRGTTLEVIKYHRIQIHYYGFFLNTI